jgi:hypothetical protein
MCRNIRCDGFFVFTRFKVMYNAETTLSFSSNPVKYVDAGLSLIEERGCSRRLVHLQLRRVLRSMTTTPSPCCMNLLTMPLIWCAGISVCTILLWKISDWGKTLSNEERGKSREELASPSRRYPWIALCSIPPPVRHRAHWLFLCCVISSRMPACLGLHDLPWHYSKKWFAMALIGEEEREAGEKRELLDGWEAHSGRIRIRKIGSASG